MTIRRDTRHRMNGMPRRLLTVPVTAIALSLTLVAACSGEEEEDAAPAAEDAPPGDEATPAEVTIEQSRFEPDELTVAAGTDVSWTNFDAATHTVTSAEDSTVAFDSGDIGQDEVFRQTFAEPGSYDYFCEVHPTMRSTVVVE